MSQPSPINITFLQTFILQESENEAIQKLDPNFYESLSKYIGDLKNEEREGVEDKIKNGLLSMVTDIASLLLKLRLEKAISGNSGTSGNLLLAEEKFILDSQVEMDERKDVILSGILSGDTKLLGPNNIQEFITKKPQDD